MRIAAGAEATIYKEDAIIKVRHAKRYRHEELDRELRRARTRREANLLKRGLGPRLIDTDREERITMEYVPGCPVKEVLDNRPEVARRIGQLVAALHDQHVIHGDLTTSNMLYDEDVRLIDFGLSFTSHDAEHKAVDLHLFKQALESKHHRVYEQALKAFLEGYQPGQRDEILRRLEIVERRGRNRAKT